MLIDIQTASPPFTVTQQKAAEELKKRMSIRPAVSRLIDAASTHSGIESRWIVIPDAEENPDYRFYSFNGNGIIPNTKTRMEEYKKWAKILTVNAVNKLKESTKFNPETINRLITVSCTGFYAPGLDYDLINEFGIPLNVKRTNIGFMGCAASLVGFANVMDFLKSKEEQNILLTSVEICSLHLQMEPTRDNILANMIFADGAAAVLFSNSNNVSTKPKLKILYAHSILFNCSSDVMGWEIGNTGFIMNLSPELPKIIYEHAVPALVSFLKKNSIDINEISHWALHPGGRAVLDALQSGLNLTEQKMLPSRNVLLKYGNMSSASILFVLKEILDTLEIKPGELFCAVAFGPGLTMEVIIMEGC